MWSGRLSTPFTRILFFRYDHKLLGELLGKLAGTEDRMAVFDYIEGWYNSNRRHSSGW